MTELAGDSERSSDLFLTIVNVHSQGLSLLPFEGRWPVTAVTLRIEHIVPPGEPANAAGPTPENLILGTLSKAHRFTFL